MFLPTEAHSQKSNYCTPCLPKFKFCSSNNFVKVETQSMFTEPDAKKEPNEGDTQKTTAAESQFPASQGAEGKSQGN